MKTGISPSEIKKFISVCYVTIKNIIESLTMKLKFFLKCLIAQTKSIITLAFHIFRMQEKLHYIFSLSQRWPLNTGSTVQIRLNLWHTHEILKFSKGKKLVFNPVNLSVYFKTSEILRFSSGEKRYFTQWNKKVYFKTSEILRFSRGQTVFHPVK